MSNARQFFAADDIFKCIFFLGVRVNLSSDGNLQVSSVDNLCEQFGPRSGPWSGSKLFDTHIVFLKEFFEKDDFGKKKKTTKHMKKYPACRVTSTNCKVNLRFT